MKSSTIARRVFFILCSSFCWGCADDRSDSLEMEYKKVEIDVSLQRTSYDAIEIVRSHLRSSVTRSGDVEDSISIKSILSTDVYEQSVIQEYGSDIVDTILYVLNVNEDGGFYLISGDNRIPGVLGYSDSGKFEIVEDTTVESSSRLIVDMIANYNLSITEDIRIRETSPWLPPEKPIFPEGPIVPDTVGVWRPYANYSSWETIDSVDKMIPVEWHQYYPYNSKLPYVRNGIHYPAGCVPIAVAQLLTYYRMPTGIYHNYCYDWDLITACDSVADAHHVAYVGEVSNLVKWICDDLNVTFGENGTLAYTDDVPEFLSKLGFSHPSSLKKYNANSLLQSLKGGHPVIVRGKETANAYSGHAWIVDGYKYQQCIKTSNNSSGTPIRERVDRIMLHCNWGHIGHNGYYLEGLFDEYHKQNGLGGDTEGYYQYDLKMIDNIYP